MSEEDSEEDVRSRAPASVSKAKSKNPIISISDESTSSSDDVMITPTRKRLRKASNTPKQGSRDNDMDHDQVRDIEEDLEDLKDTGACLSTYLFPKPCKLSCGVEKHIMGVTITRLRKQTACASYTDHEIEVRTMRTRGSRRTPKKTKAQEQLELLRRRRAGANVDVLPSDNPSQDSDTRRGLYDTTSDEDGDDSSSSQASEATGINDRLTPRRENLDAYEADFVIDDDEEAPIGAPDDLTPSMPFEFTRHAHKKPLEHFNDVLEWVSGLG